MQKYTAIVLSSCDVNEYDRIYFLYTLEQGLVRAVARSVRKPAAKLVGHLEPGTLSEIYVARARGMGQITSAITISNFDKIKKDYGKLSEVLKIFRFFTKKFSEEEKDERIFSLLSEFLGLASQVDPEGGEDRGKLLLEAFWWKLFDLLGNKPEVARCVNCENMLAADKKKIFSAIRGGVFCAACAGASNDTLPISDNQIKLLRLIFSNSLKALLKIKFKREESESLGRIRVNYLEYHFG